MLELNPLSPIVCLFTLLTISLMVPKLLVRYNSNNSQIFVFVAYVFGFISKKSMPRPMSKAFPRASLVIQQGKLLLVKLTTHIRVLV